MHCACIYHPSLLHPAVWGLSALLATAGCLLLSLPPVPFACVWCCHHPHHPLLLPLLFPLVLVVVHPLLLSVVCASIVPVIPMIAVGWEHVVSLSCCHCSWLGCWYCQGGGFGGGWSLGAVCAGLPQAWGIRHDMGTGNTVCIWK
jgi:hypothetical protein